jgi:hypothetical protein
MFPPGLLLALGGTLLLTVADSVPVLNVDSGCRAAAKMGDSLSLDTTMRQCLADENSARDELQKQWAQFALALRQRCVATTAAIPATSKFSSACRWGATPRRWKSLQGAVGKNDTNHPRNRDLLTYSLCCRGAARAQTTVNSAGHRFRFMRSSSRKQ